MEESAAYTKLQGMIDAGRTSMMNALAEVEAEWTARRDLLVKPDAMDVEIEKSRIYPILEGEKLSTTFHSQYQLLERAGIPSPFADKLMGLGENDLLRTNIRTMLPKVSSQGILVRRVGDLAKGILSSAYRRMDAGPAFQSFVKTGLEEGFVPNRGYNTDRVYTLSMLDTDVYQPTPNEYVVYGINIQTSDYGSSALELNLMLMRIICSNLAVGMDVLRKIHLGSRFNMGEGSGPMIELSNRTHALDGRAVASAISDAVKGSRKLITGVNDAIEKAAGRAITLEDQIKALRKRGVRKEFAESVRATYESSLPVEMLPEGNSAWRLSNAISLLARNEKNPDLRLAYEREAFNVLKVA